ncbi:MAG: carboxypeptidase-like regulatory domain-containing protein [Gemmatimonadota bacterium]|nr:carboxypeptidase-like regulatory domain-containing protein [Gemmatimonadota bacterium]
MLPARLIPILVLCGAATAGSTAQAQRSGRPAAVVGKVLDADSRRPLQYVVVDIIDQERRIETDASGNFRIEGLSPQLVTVRLRQIGYPVVERSLNLFAGRETQVEYVLSKGPPRLADVVVTANRSATNLLMEGFEDRKRLGLGRFYGEDELARHRERRIIEVLRDAPGVQFVAGRGGEHLLASTRNAMGIGSARTAGACFLQVVIDGMVVWTPETSAERVTSFPPPDLGHFVAVSELIGIEVYSGVAGVPVMYRRQGNTCGVILFWTRRGDYVPIIR